jgi:hypothetical protein
MLNVYADDDEPRSPEEWFNLCVELAGGIPRMSKKIGVTRQTIYANWDGKFPDRYVVKAEKLFGVPRQLLAPHLYE